MNNKEKKKNKKSNMDDIVLLQKLLHDFVSTSKYLQQAASR